MKLRDLAWIGLVAAVAAVTIREWPEIRRYLKMKSM